MSFSKVTLSRHPNQLYPHHLYIHLDIRQGMRVCTFTWITANVCATALRTVKLTRMSSLACTLSDYCLRRPRHSCEANYVCVAKASSFLRSKRRNLRRARIHSRILGNDVRALVFLPFSLYVEDACGEWKRNEYTYKRLNYLRQKGAIAIIMRVCFAGAKESHFEQRF